MAIKQPIPIEFFDQTFRYFFPSLVCFRKIYFPLMFQTEDSIERHVAYICPLCTENYLILDKNGLRATSEFSHEDFPQKNVSGNSKILTCKTCNNEAGHKFEHELVKEVERRAINYKAKIRIEGVQGHYKGSIEQKQERVFSFDFKEKLKEDAVFLKKWIETPLPDNEFKIQIKTTPVDNNKVAKALLKTAYLFCFRNWGYDFIFSLNAERLRELLQVTGNDPSFLLAFWLDGKNHNLNEIPTGLCSLKTSSDLTSFIVNIPIRRTNYEGIASVIIPSSGEEGWKEALNIKQRFQKTPEMEITFTTETSALDIGCFNGYTSQPLSL